MSHNLDTLDESTPPENQELLEESNDEIVTFTTQEQITPLPNTSQQDMLGVMFLALFGWILLLFIAIICTGLGWFALSDNVLIAITISTLVATLACLYAQMSNIHDYHTF